MPGNIVQVNSAKELEWYVGDSKMDELIKYLDEVGFRTSKNDSPTGTFEIDSKGQNIFDVDKAISEGKRMVFLKE